MYVPPGKVSYFSSLSVAMILYLLDCSIKVSSESLQGIELGNHWMVY